MTEFIAVNKKDCERIAGQKIESGTTGIYWIRVGRFDPLQGYLTPPMPTKFSYPSQAIYKPRKK